MMQPLPVTAGAALTFLLPAAVWLVWKKKTRAPVIPLAIGLIAYTCVILPRFILRALISYNELRETNIFLWYLARGVISGGCEEGMRLAVFTFILKSSDKTGWVNCVSYGFGHGGCEALLTAELTGCGFYDCIYNGLDFAGNMAFSAAMSVLVYAAAVQAQDKRLFFAACGLHFAADIIPLFYETETVGFAGYLIIDKLFIAGCCVYAWRVFRGFRDGGQDSRGSS